MTIELDRVKAILFDFDGVLGNSVEDNQEAWKFAFSKYELPFDSENYFLLEGKKSDEIIKGLLMKIGVYDKVDFNQILAVKTQYYKDNNSFSYYPGVKELLELLSDKEVKHAVVSGGSKKRITSYPSNQLIKHLEVVISGEDVNNSKPDPEPYLSAAERLRVEPSACLVIENAPLGITAAKRAGMQCIALCTTLNSKYLEEADYILPDMKELCNFINPLFSI